MSPASMIAAGIEPAAAEQRDSEQARIELSIAISLKRIADALEVQAEQTAQARRDADWAARSAR